MMTFSTVWDVKDVVDYDFNWLVSKSKVVIFGGATGDTGKYIITGDTYALDIISSKWTKLEGKKQIENC